MGFLPAEVLAEAQGSTVGLVGPSTQVTVPGVLDEDTGESPIGASLDVLLVDLELSVAQQFRLPAEVEELAATFSAEDPFATPESRGLLNAAREWAHAMVVQDQELSEGWYSAEGAAAREMQTPPKRPPRRRAPNGGYRYRQWHSKSKEAYHGQLAGFSGFSASDPSRADNGDDEVSRAPSQLGEPGSCRAVCFEEFGPAFIIPGTGSTKDFGVNRTHLAASPKDKYKGTAGFKRKRCSRGGFGIGGRESVANRAGFGPYWRSQQPSRRWWPSSPAPHQTQ